MLCEIERSDYDFPVSEGDFVNQYLGVFDGAQAVAYCHTQIVPGANFVYLHLYVLKTTRRVMSLLKAGLQEYKATLRDHGFAFIMGMRAASDDIKTWLHFVGLIDHGYITSRVVCDGIPAIAVKLEV